MSKRWIFSRGGYYSGLELNHFNIKPTFGCFQGEIFSKARRNHIVVARKRSRVSSQVKVVFVMFKKSKLSMGPASPILLRAAELYCREEAGGSWPHRKLGLF